MPRSRITPFFPDLFFFFWRGDCEWLVNYITLHVQGPRLGEKACEHGGMPTRRTGDLPGGQTDTARCSSAMCLGDDPGNLAGKDSSRRRILEVQHFSGFPLTLSLTRFRNGPCTPHTSDIRWLSGLAPPPAPARSHQTRTDVERLPSTLPLVFSISNLALRRRD